MAARFEVDKRSIELTIVNFRGSIARIKQAEQAAVAVAGAKLTSAIRQNITIPPIGGSPEAHRDALAALDHPYARRQGSIQLSPNGGVPGFSDRTLLVHTVSGAFARSLTTAVDLVGPDGPTFGVGFDDAIAPHAKFVVRGTDVMYPRDILWATANDRAVREEMLRAIVFVMGRVFRTQAGIRFR